jgi:hypothetical protein
MDGQNPPPTFVNGCLNLEGYLIRDPEAIPQNNFPKQVLYK